MNQLTDLPQYQSATVLIQTGYSFYNLMGNEESCKQAMKKIASLTPQMLLQTKGKSRVAATDSSLSTEEQATNAFALIQVTLKDLPLNKTETIAKFDKMIKLIEDFIVV